MMMMIEALLKEAENAEPIVIAPAEFLTSWLHSSLKQSGTSGPFSWEIECYLNKEDLQNSFASVCFYAFGADLINTRLDFLHPNIVLTNLSPFGFPLSVESGIDFAEGELYMEVTLSNLSHRWVITTF